MDSFINDESTDDSESNISSFEVESSDHSSKSEFEERKETQEVSKSDYEERVADMTKTSEQIFQHEKLLKLSQYLPDNGDKLKKILAKLKLELAAKEEALKNLVVKDPEELALDFQNLSINGSTENGTVDEGSTPDKESDASYNSDDTNEPLNRRLFRKDGISKFIQQLRDSEDSMPTENDLADQPLLLVGNLLPHQRRALRWMTWRETQFPSGGILADDMGLGKTLTTISLIAQHFENRSSTLKEKEENRPKWNGRTLVICPASVLRQWEEEIHKFTNHALSVGLHHGDKRTTRAKDLTLSEVVITTYGIVRIEVENDGALSKLHWERIVLDEAHTIKNYTSRQSLCCSRLKGTSKWALTGTPIQNKHSDVYALMKFLQCSPLDTFAQWKIFTKKKAQERISNLLKFVLLRRTKQELGQVGELVSLPRKILEIVPVHLTPDELKVYETVSAFSETLTVNFIQTTRGTSSTYGDDLKKALKFFSITGSISSSHILLAILRLRQICIHPHLIDAMLVKDEICDFSADESVLEDLKDVTICGDAVKRSNPVFDPQRSSSKLDAVLDIILEKVLKRQEKAVVVSQFTSVLKLFEHQLANHQVKYLALTGSTKVSQRQSIVESFNNSPDEQILLLSLSAGGVGLNLCGANNLIFIDPHWNPQLENQAEDRVYRIGQTKNVTIYRCICKGTIEERIEKLQAKKRHLAKNILHGYKLKLDDMLELI